MDFLLIKGKDFSENFNFKNSQGKSIALPNGEFRLTLERGSFGRVYTLGNGLTRTRTNVTWRIDAEDTNFEYSTLYYTLYLDDQELARGIVRVQ